MTRPLCFWHSSDLDGACSAAIVKFNIGYVELYPINYGDAIPWDKITTDREVYMVDFSLPIADMNNLVSRTRNLVWIDHHKTAMEMSQENDFRCTKLLCEGIAGCELTCMFFLANKDVVEAGLIAARYKCGDRTMLPQAVTLLGRYDVWDNKDIDMWNERILPFQYGMRLQDTNPESNGKLWDTLLSTNICTDGITYEGGIVLKYQKQQNKMLSKTLSFPVTINGYKAIVCNHGPTNSQLFDMVWTEKEYDLMIAFYYKPKHKKWVYSFYTTKKDVDCSAIAKQYGGGGHSQAAGCETDDILFEIKSVMRVI